MREVLARHPELRVIVAHMGLPESRRLTEALTRARAALGEQRCTEATHQGRALSPPEVVDLALEAVEQAAHGTAQPRSGP